MSVQLPITPPQAAKHLLQTLQAKRMREVLERRFGLRGGEPQTLEAIGQSYKITRERVRQIEADAMRRLGAAAGQMDDFFRPIEAEMRARGEVIAEEDFFSRFAPRRWYPHLRLVLTVAPHFHFVPESEEYHPHWAINPLAADKAQNIVKQTVARLSERGQPADKKTLYQFVSLDEETASNPDSATVADSYLGISRLIAVNPYGEYGLITWPTITPRGIKDKAHAVLAKAGKPLHFREVASAIDKVGWGNKPRISTSAATTRGWGKTNVAGVVLRGKKKAHPQTVHNELIKDGRFVLVGRGLYALREWGYEPGTVHEVLVSLLKSSSGPLDREEIVRLASEKRMVKPQTILLNLQDRNLFKRTEDGKYTLA